MPFELRNAAQSFQRFINEVTRGLEFVFAYLDNLLIASSSADEHINHLRALCTRLNEYGLVLNPTKDVLGVSSIDFLGHRVTAEGIALLQAKVEAVLHFPQPTSQRKVRGFLGLVNFRRHFIPNGAKILLPLSNLLKKTSSATIVIEWTSELASAFSAAKEALADTTLLAHPQLDTPTRLMTYAFSTAVGAVLQKFLQGHWMSLGFFSRKLEEPETRYSVFG